MHSLLRSVHGLRERGTRVRSSLPLSSCTRYHVQANDAARQVAAFAVPNSLHSPRAVRDRLTAENPEDVGKRY